MALRENYLEDKHSRVRGQETRREWNEVQTPWTSPRPWCVKQLAHTPSIPGVPAARSGREGTVGRNKATCQGYMPKLHAVARTDHVQLIESHEDLPRLGAFRGPQDARVVELVHDAGGAPVPDLQAALKE